MIFKPRFSYKNGLVEYFDHFNCDESSILDLRRMVKQLRFCDKKVQFWYEYGNTRRPKLMKLSCDNLGLTTDIPVNKEFNIYVEHLYDDQWDYDVEISRELGDDTILHDGVFSEDESRGSDSVGEQDYGNQVDVEGPAIETNNLRDTATSSKSKGGLGEQTEDFVEIECNMLEQILRSLCDSDFEGAVHGAINMFEERNLKEEGFKFVIGMVFNSSTEFKWAVQYHEAMRQKDVMFKKNEARRLRAICRHNKICQWSIFCSRSNLNSPFIVKTYNHVHICGNQDENKVVTSGFLAKVFKDDFRPIWQKRKLQHFKLLNDYCEELRRSNPGTTVKIKLDSEFIVNGRPRFERLYICFGASKEGPRHFLRRMEEDPLWDAPEYEYSAEEEARFPSMTTRCSARVLVLACQKFSRRQRLAVRQLGFEKLLDLEIMETPGRLGRGGVAVTYRGSNDVSEFLLSWRHEFLKVKHDITPNMISKKMESLLDRGGWFRHHFTTLMVSTLIRCMNNGYAYQNIFDDWEVVENIKDLNWCRFVLDSLVETRALWMFYVDRVARLGGPVPRAVPAFRGWTSKLLRAREFIEIQSGGFGLGAVQPRFCDLPNVGQAGGAPMEEDDRDQSLIERVTQKAKAAASSIRELMKVLHEAAGGTSELQADSLVRVVGAAQRLVGLRPSGGIHGMTTERQADTTTFTQSEDAFWADPENLRAVEEIERTILERNAIQELPSFSLGISQVSPTRGWDDVVGVAQQYDDGVGGTGGGGGVLPVGDGGPSIMPRRGGPTSRLSAPFVDAPVKMGRPRGDGPLGGERGTSLMTRFVPETPSEHVFYSWIVDNPYANIHEQLFSYNGWAATREDMLSLGIGSPVRVAVIDVSACILNVRELSRGEGAPRRQFTGIHTTLNTVVSRTQSRACRLAWFSESLECGLKLSPHPSWKSIDMDGLFYVITVDMVQKRMFIIDNLSAPVSKEDKYGATPEVLKDLLSVFLDDEVDFIYRATVRRFVPTRMQMQWRDARNKVDCGVFAMRHMESFLGQSVNAWECGLQTGDTRELQNSGDAQARLGQGGTRLPLQKLRMMSSFALLGSEAGRSTIEFSRCSCNTCASADTILLLPYACPTHLKNSSNTVVISDFPISPSVVMSRSLSP
nr:uncharacterized protein LOC109150412 [Ipomoea batatas]